MVIPISLFTLRFLPKHIIIRRILKEKHNRMVVLQILQPISDYKCAGGKVLLFVIAALLSNVSVRLINHN